ncbi:MAG: protoporphyrinogen oxidase [Vicingaceae bacterium]|jgi:protoporphyrinogen oxidase
MSKKDKKINIIGAGVSGLIAAIVLEKAGYAPHIFEKTDRVGGRVKTEIKGEHVFDHGFQVLLESYPMAKKYLDYPSLDLQQFWPGSIIFENKKATKFGDPLRNSKLLLPTLFSQHATFSDKLNVFRLNNELKNQSLDEIFEKKETTTMNYLQTRGFSSVIIHDFFQPFFSGIFLETALSTSSRMFEFVFKMFAEGQASVPKKGIEEIPKQLASQLKYSTFHFNVAVSKVDTSGITIEGLPKVESDYTIVATEADELISNLRDQKIDWKACYCYYFETPKKVISEKLIGLIPGKHHINNLHYVNSLTKSSKNLLSVTVVDNKGLAAEELVSQVKKELSELCGIQVGELKHSFIIPKALPNLQNLQNEIPPSQTQLLDRVFLAGDVTLNGSLNAAMMAGEKAAQAVLDKIERRIS